MFALFRQIPRSRFVRYSHKIALSDEIQEALQSKKPIVALESTIITHGMPFPNNVKCALDVEDIVRSHGAIPATVAIIAGAIKVGLSKEELQELGDITISRPIKTSRRDLAYVVSHKRNGGTTVSGTLIVAHQVGIPIFATGGIGGVHREAEHTFDISADLIELGKSSVAVVSSGIKSILDIPKTLEFLETQGVFVATYGSTTEFPAFYTAESGLHVPYNVGSALEAARIIAASLGLGLGSGMLLAVPVPQVHSLDAGVMDAAIKDALKSASQRGIAGKEITPFLLGQIGEITQGESLKTNIALIKNNAKCAAEIAVALAGLRGERHYSTGPRAVVIGGSNLDCSIQLQDAEIKMDGRIHHGKYTLSAGGVARNISDALHKLGSPPIFISAVGKDTPGRLLQELMPEALSINLLEAPTAQCTIFLDSKGDCQFLTGDMDIHARISPEMIVAREDSIKEAPLIVFDANLTLATIGTLLELAEKHHIPAFFEPTDVIISSKPFETQHWKAVKFITPNLNELRHIASHFKITPEKPNLDKIQEAASLSSQLAHHIDNVIVTLGADGLIIARKATATEPFLRSGTNNEKVSVRHYPAQKVQNFVNVNGAGDNLASGLIIAILDGLSEEKCVSVGLAAAETALFTRCSVAGTIFGRTHPAWNAKAQYTTII